MLFMRGARALLVLGIAALVLGIALLLVWRFARPRVTQEEIQQSVYMAIVREAPASFFVTGTLDLTATTTVTNTRYLFPQSFRLSLGTTSSTIRVPGRISYGFDVRELRPEMITVADDGAIEVRLPPLRVHAVDTDLSRIEVETERGWLRTETSEERVEQRALALIRASFHRQGVQHLRDSSQPRVNSARALQLLIEPVLAGLGLEQPRLRFLVAPDVRVERGPAEIPRDTAAVERP